MYTREINIEDFGGNPTLTVEVPETRLMQLYSSSGNNLIDNSNVVAQTQNNISTITIAKVNYPDEFFPLTLVCIDIDDTTSSKQLFDLTRTSYPDNDDRVAIGRKGHTCVNVKYEDFSRYMTDSLGFLPKNPFNWNINPLIARDKLDLMSKEQQEGLDLSVIHIQDIETGSKAYTQPQYSYDGIIQLYGMRVDNLTQHYSISLSSYHWRGTGRGEVMRIGGIGPGSDVPNIYAPIDVPVFMFGNVDKSISLSNINGWNPPAFVITPNNRTITIKGENLKPSSLYMIIFDWTSAYGIMDQTLSYVSYRGYTTAISDLQ